MINTVKKHLDNDARLIKQAWENMDTLSHVLVVLGITLLFMATDMIAGRIHF
jgi:hypothetical protein